MRSGTRARNLTLACCSSLAACGSSDSNLLVTVSGVPAIGVTLSVNGTLDGRPAAAAMKVPAAGDGTQVGVVIPSGSSGHLSLTISALDTDGCARASGQVDADLPVKRADLSVQLAALSPRQCRNLAPCMAGKLCAPAQPATTNDLWGLWANSPSDIWAVGATETALHYDGASWQNTVVPLTSKDLNSVWSSGPSDVWAVGALGSLVHFDGQGWSVLSGGSSAVYDLYGVSGVNANDVYAVGLNGAPFGSGPGEFWHWNGQQWNKVSTGIPGGMLSVWANSDSDVTAVGYGGLLIHFDGGNWSATTVTSNDLRSVWGDGKNLLFAGGAMGTVLRKDSGGSWTAISATNYSATLYGITGSGSTVYGVGNKGANGNFVTGSAPYNSFGVQDTGTTNALTAVVVGSDGIGWVTGRSGYLAYFDTRP